MMIDTTKATGVECIIWSGLLHCSKLNSGKITHVGHYNSKAVASECGCQSGIPFIDMQAGFYASNFLNLWSTLVKWADGVYAIPLPLSPTVHLPVIDMARDYGLYVLRTLEALVFPDGSEVHTGLDITMEEGAIQLSQITGKRIVIEQITLDQYGKKMADNGAPPHVVVDMLDAWKWFEEFGYYGGKAISSVEGLAGPPLSFMEFAKAEDWSKVLSNDTAGIKSTFICAS